MEKAKSYIIMVINMKENGKIIKKIAKDVQNTEKNKINFSREFENDNEKKGEGLIIKEDYKYI